MELDRKSPESVSEGLGGLRTGKCRPGGRGALCKGFATASRGCCRNGAGGERAEAEGWEARKIKSEAAGWA